MKPDLPSLVARVNSLDGYTNRYRVVLAAVRKAGQPRLCMLVKAVGTLDARETPWLPPPELAAYMIGFLAGHATAHRRIARQQVPFTFNKIGSSHD